MENFMENYLGIEDYPWAKFFEENVPNREVHCSARAIIGEKTSKNALDESVSSDPPHHSVKVCAKEPELKAPQEVHVAFVSEEKIQSESNSSKNTSEKVGDEEHLADICMDGGLSADEKEAEHFQNEIEVKEESTAAEKSSSNTNNDTEKAHNGNFLFDIGMINGFITSMYIPDLDMIPDVDTNEVDQVEMENEYDNIKENSCIIDSSKSEIATNESTVVLGAEMVLEKSVISKSESDADLDNYSSAEEKTNSEADHSQISTCTNLGVDTSHITAEHEDHPKKTLEEVACHPSDAAHSGGVSEKQESNDADKIRSSACTVMGVEANGIMEKQEYHMKTRKSYSKTEEPDFNMETVDCCEQWKNMLGAAVEEALCNAGLQNFGKSENHTDQKNRSKASPNIEKCHSHEEQKKLLDIVNKVASSNMDKAYSYVEWRDMLYTAIEGMYNLEENSETDSTDKEDNAEQTFPPTNESKMEKSDPWEGWSSMICNAIEVGIRNVGKSMYSLKKDNSNEKDREPIDKLVAKESQVSDAHAEQKTAPNNADVSLNQMLEKPILEENICVKPDNISNKVTSNSRNSNEDSTVTATPFARENGKNLTDSNTHINENEKQSFEDAPMDISKKQLKLRENTATDELATIPSTTFRLLLIGSRAVTLWNWTTPLNGQVKRWRLIIFFPHKNNHIVVSMPGVYLKVQYYLQQARILSHMSFSQNLSISNELHLLYQDSSLIPMKANYDLLK